MFIIRHYTTFLIASASVVLVSLAVMIVLGFNWGIDFTGGTLVAVTYPKGRPSPDAVRSALRTSGFHDFELQPAGESGYIVRAGRLSENERLRLLDALSERGNWDLIEDRFSSIGPSVGDELARKALVAIALVSLCIIVFLAFAFRGVSHGKTVAGVKNVGSWTYGIVAVVTLLHDMSVPAAVFSVLGHIEGVPIDILFVTALLAILGYSVNDTIIIFDRIRENLARTTETKRPESFENVVGRSISETYGRSINTSLTTALALTALLVWGSEATRYFSLAMLVGVVAGTYSSICLASPLLVVVQKWRFSRTR